MALAELIHNAGLVADENAGDVWPRLHELMTQHRAWDRFGSLTAYAPAPRGFRPGFQASGRPLTGSNAGSGTSEAAEKARKLPVYWKVHTGDSYQSIAAKTGLTTDQLETFNPYVNPDTIQRWRSR